MLLNGDLHILRNRPSGAVCRLPIKRTLGVPPAGLNYPPMQAAMQQLTAGVVDCEPGQECNGCI